MLKCFSLILWQISLCSPVMKANFGIKGWNGRDSTALDHYRLNLIYAHCPRPLDQHVRAHHQPCIINYFFTFFHCEVLGVGRGRRKWQPRWLAEVRSLLEIPMVDDCNKFHHASIVNNGNDSPTPTPTHCYFLRSIHSNETSIDFHIKPPESTWMLQKGRAAVHLEVLNLHSEWRNMNWYWLEGGIWWEKPGRFHLEHLRIGGNGCPGFKATLCQVEESNHHPF